MTAVNGDVVWSATYGAFGNATVDPASTVTSNLRFPGQYFDDETGNHYNWYRYYDPASGRYVEKDPVGLRGGINLFSYVQNNATNKIDQFGLRTWTVDSAGGSYGLSIIIGVSGQKIRFISNCENGTRLKKTYLVVGAGIGLSAKITIAGNSSGHLGATTVTDNPSPVFGFSATGPSAALLNYAGVGGLTLASANLAFNFSGNSYSEVYALTTGPGLGASIFNFEGRLYIPFPWFDKPEKCCK